MRLHDCKMGGVTQPGSVQSCPSAHKGASRGPSGMPEGLQPSFKDRRAFQQSSRRARPDLTSCNSLSRLSSLQADSDPGEVSHTATVEMFLMDGPPTASLDEPASTESDGAQPQLQRRQSRRVAPPRANPLPIAAQGGSPLPALPHQQSAQAKKLRVELSMAQSELHSTQTEMRQASLTIRQQEREVARLRAALAERDDRLRESKAETGTARAALQVKEGEMKQAYQRLTAACSERSTIRRALIDSQAEAADLRAELQAWTQDLHELRNVIDSLEENESAQQPQLPLPEPSAAALAQLQSANSKLRGSPAAGPSDGAAMQLLKDLTDLSQQIASDAREDAEIFAQAAAAGNGVAGLSR